MDTYTATHCKQDTHVSLYGDDGVVIGHRVDEFNVAWISISWQDGTRTELPVTDCEDLKKGRQHVYFEPTEIYTPPTAVTPEHKRR
jgi:hypothetical protein